MGEGYGLASEAIEWCLGRYLTDPAQRHDPRFAPLLSPDLASAPPAVVVGAGLDPLRDEARALSERLRISAVPVHYVEEPTLPHGFWKFAPGADAPWLRHQAPGNVAEVNLVELGAFLKSRRDRVRPGDVGLPAGPRRRVSGLRRDEVAQLAGASVDYYIELERGAGAQPSEQMLAALARALRLSRDERDHLFSLAGRSLPADGGPADHVHPGMLDLLHRLDGTPAQVVTDLRVPLVQNRLAVALLGPPPTTTGWTASFLYRWFTDPASRTIYPAEDHDEHARSFVADLRAAMARRGGDDPDVAALIADLTARSPEFARLWARHDVGFRRHERKRIVHPELGLLEVNCLSLFSEDGKQRLLWFTPVVGTDSVAKLELLAVVGTQRLLPSSGDEFVQGDR